MAYQQHQHSYLCKRNTATGVYNYIPYQPGYNSQIPDWFRREQNPPPHDYRYSQQAYLRRNLPSAPAHTSAYFSLANRPTQNITALSIPGCVNLGNEVSNPKTATQQLPNKYGITQRIPTRDRGYFSYYREQKQEEPQTNYRGIDFPQPTRYPPYIKNSTTMLSSSQPSAPAVSRPEPTPSQPPPPRHQYVTQSAANAHATLDQIPPDRRPEEYGGHPTSPSFENPPLRRIECIGLFVGTSNENALLWTVRNQARMRQEEIITGKQEEQPMEVLRWDGYKLSEGTLVRILAWIAVTNREILAKNTVVAEVEEANLRTLQAIFDSRKSRSDEGRNKKENRDGEQVQRGVMLEEHGQAAREQEKRMRPFRY